MGSARQFKPEVSILMPYRNEERHLRQCIQSIVDQSFKNWELLAVDDHSTDKSNIIVNEYTRKDERIRFLKNEGIGIIDALHTGYKYSSGIFITRMDADDVMKPEKLFLLLNTCKERGSGYVSIGMVEYFSDERLGQGYLSYADWLNTHTINGTNLDEIYLECPIPSPCWMVHRLDLNRCGAFTPDDYPEDYDLTFRMKESGIKVAGINQVLHLWRDHEHRSSRNSPHYQDNRFTKMKVRYFLRQDYINHLPLVLWGAGRKGKAVAQALLSANTDFNWITNNPNKTGLTIYDTKIKSDQLLNSLQRCQVIIAFSTFHDPETYIEILNTYPQHQFFRFF